MDDKNRRMIKPDFTIEFEEILLDESYESEPSNIKRASLGGLGTDVGMKKQSLQDAIDNFSSELNKAAIAKSTGRPVMTPSAQYKGFAAEEHFKQTLKINALAKGENIEVFTSGRLPDGTTLSGIDMEVDISIWRKKYPWNKSIKIGEYQSKIHNNPSDYAKDILNKQYENVEFVGGAGQGVNDKVRVTLGKKEITSDSITPENATKLADAMKEQNVPNYDKAAEKHAELDKINLLNAVTTGTIAGFVLSLIKEVATLIKSGDDLKEDQFVESFKNIMLGSADGGVRAAALVSSTQLVSKIVGKEVMANSLGAVPVTVAANTTVDLAKDLYRCFVNQTIDADDLLCNTINNVYNSAAGYLGSYAGSQISVFLTAKSAAATGATIGSTLGPLGTVIGSVVGGFIIGLGAQSIINTANKDAISEFVLCVEKINSNIELSGVEKLYYFADELDSISDFKLSFKSLLPCYNLISDMKEYNLRKKAIKNIDKQMELSLNEIDSLKNEEFTRLLQFHQQRIEELNEKFEELHQIYLIDYGNSINTYISDSYMQHLSIASINNLEINELKNQMNKNFISYNVLFEEMNYRKEVNSQINKTLESIILDSQNEEILKRFIEKIQRFMEKDKLLISKQYISFEESILLIGGEIE